ncbi:MAG: DUF58 domain-containing protein, partial [Proteobacteria bacterium]|nr:DUF58 domain-containing protein [Pseudomonadota bacterium]
MTTARPERPPSLYTMPLIWAILGAILLAALLNGEQDLILLGLAVFGVLGLAWSWSRMARSGLSFDLAVNRGRIFPGEVFTLEMSAENRSVLPFWFQASPPFARDVRRIDETPTSMGNAALFGRQTACFRWELTADRRGVFRLGPDRVRSGDLLGLFPIENGTGAESEIVVYPRRVVLRPLPWLKRELFGLPGFRSPVVDPVYLMGTRDYQSGRPARFIHWRASARHQRWQEKVFEPSSQAKVLLMLDVSGFVEHEAEAAFESALEVLASLTVALDRDGAQVGLSANGVLAGRGSGRIAANLVVRRPDRILETLARLRFQPAGRFSTGPLPGSARAPGTSLVYCTFEYDDDAAAVGALLGRPGRPVAFLVHRSDGGPAKGPVPVNGRLLVL